MELEWGNETEQAVTELVRVQALKQQSIWSVHVRTINTDY